MAFNRFSKLRNQKVRDIYNAIKNRSKELQAETNLCMDEQIVSSKGQINIKQYLPKNPKKNGA